MPHETNSVAPSSSEDENATNPDIESTPEELAEGQPEEGQEQTAGVTPDHEDGDGKEAVAGHSDARSAELDDADPGDAMAAAGAAEAAEKAESSAEADDDSEADSEADGDGDSEADGEEIEDNRTFADLDLQSEILQALDDMAYFHPMPVQLAVFDHMSTGQDVMVQSRTGSGKTAAFGIPIAQVIDPGTKGAQALILAPTRELARQVARELTSITAHKSIAVVPIYGGAPMKPQMTALTDGAQIVAGTPGRVLDHLRRGTLKGKKITTLVLDECDEMLSMGFQEEIEKIIAHLPAKEKRQTVLFSATIPEEIQRIARRHMTEPVEISLSSDSIGVEEIDHYYYVVTGMARKRDLLKVLKAENPDSAIIFCNTRDETAVIAKFLRDNDYDAEAISSDLTQRDRERVMQRMRDKNLRFLVATDVAARGIDISGLSHVINYTFPESAQVYVHRTGRTGRAGKSGVALSLIGPRELGSFYYLKLLYKIRPEERDLPSGNDMAAMVEGERYRDVIKKVEDDPTDEYRSLARRVWQSDQGERVLGFLLQQLFTKKPAPAPRRQERSSHSESPDDGHNGERKERSRRDDRGERRRDRDDRGRRDRDDRRGRRRDRDDREERDDRSSRPRRDRDDRRDRRGSSDSYDRSERPRRERRFDRDEQRLDRGERPERPERSDRPDRPERGDRPDRSERSDRPDRDEQRVRDSRDGRNGDHRDGARRSNDEERGEKRRRERRDRRSRRPSVVDAEATATAMFDREESRTPAPPSEPAPPVVKAAELEAPEPRTQPPETQPEARPPETQPEPVRAEPVSYPAYGSDVQSAYDRGNPEYKEFWEIWADERSAGDQPDVRTDRSNGRKEESRRAAESSDDRRSRDSSRRRSAEPDADAGDDNGSSEHTTRLYVNLGKREEITTEQIREILGKELGDDSERIGSIALRSTHCYVRVPDDLVDKIIDTCAGKLYQDREMVVERARR